MSDTLTNALAQSAHSQSVLAGIQNPAVVNPLAGMGSAISTVQGMQGLAAKQGEQLVGQALQQATDENGNLDFAKAQKIVAGMGPSAAYAMQGFLKTSSQLRGEQINNVAGSMKLRGLAAMSALKDASDGNINTIFDNLISNGMSAAEANQERARILAMDSVGRQQEAYRYGIQSLEQMHQVIGQTTSENIGGQIVPKTIGQPSPWGPGSLTGGPGAINTTMSPDSVMQYGITYPATADDVKAGRAGSVGETVRVPGPDVVKRFGYGGLLPAGAQIETAPSGGGGGGRGDVVDNTGKPVSPSNPPRLLKLPGQTTPAPAPYQGTGTGGPTDTVPIYQPPAPGPRSSLEGGVPVASANPLLAPTVGAPGPPSPLVPGDVNAIMIGMNRNRATPAPGTQVAGASFATGPGYDEQVTAKTSQDRLAADQTAAANYAANVFPQTQALAALGRGVTTAPGADVANMMKGWAGGVYRSLGGTGAFDSTKDFDEVHKWYNQIALGNPLAAGSDARLATTLAGNANTSIHELAGADMMKAGIALMRMNATASDQWVNNPAIRAQYGYYTNYLRDFNKTVDPRAFAWDMYNDAQKADLVADLEKHRSDPSYAQKLRDSLNMVRSSGYIGEIRAMPNAR